MLKELVSEIARDLVDDYDGFRNVRHVYLVCLTFSRERRSRCSSGVLLVMLMF
jgi:hypothetical protein